MSEHPSTQQGTLAPREGRKQSLVAFSYILRALIAIAIVGVGVLIFKLAIGSRKPPPRVTVAPTPMVVSTVEVRRVDAPRVWFGYGTARAMVSADVSSEVNARVIERPSAIEPGEPIAASGLILRLDATDYRQALATSEQMIGSIRAEVEGYAIDTERLGAQLRLAQQEADSARRDHARAVEANTGGAGSSSEVDNRLSALHRAERATETIRQQIDLIPTRKASATSRIAAEQARQRLAQHNLDRTTITSPIAGVLQLVGPEQGEWIGAGQVVARIVDLGRIEVPLRIPVSAGGSFAIGDPVDLQSSIDDGQPWVGRVARIAPETDEQSRTMTVFVVVDQNPADPDQQLLRPGQFVTGTVFGKADGPRLIIPRRALDGDLAHLASPIAGGQSGADEGYQRVQPVSVRVAYHLERALPEIDPNETEWAVLDDSSPLAPGMLVIVSNHEQLRAELIVDARPIETGRAVGAKP